MVNVVVPQIRKHPISCFVIACNESDRIAKCLSALSGWADELIVLDSGSTDDTVKIAQQYATVYQTDWPGYGPQRNRALALCRHDWVLNIDADEVMSDDLKNEVDEVLSQTEIAANLIQFKWRTFFFGKALRFGRYASAQGKLFLKTGAQFKDRQVHETLLLPNQKSLTLKHRLTHHSWRNYQHVQEKHLKYACLLAQEKYSKGKRTSIRYACLRFFTDFTQQYLLRLGCLDGWRGFLMAIVIGQYAFHKYAALAELTDKGE